MSHPQLSRLVTPRSIAFVGANDKGNAGARAVALALRLGFDGAIYPVNPNYREIQGLACYASLADLPQTPDLAVVAAPGAAALGVLAAAEAAGVPAAIFFSNGFSDAGDDEGRRRQAALVAIAQRSGMAIGGPNCAGLLSFRRGLNASFIALPDDKFESGGVSIVSQSGGLINALAELGAARGLGFNYFISTGNEAVVQTADHLEFLAEDPDTKVIISIVESVKDGARFRAALMQASRAKPVVVLKLGRTRAGQRATAAHTGALAGRDDVFAALCQHCGAILVETLDQALETAALLSVAPLPKGDRAVIFSTSGGATALTTDLATGLGLRFPPLAPATNATLQRVFGAERPFINPFDVGAAPLLIKGRNMTLCLEALLDDETVDLAACVLVISRDFTEKRAGLVEQARAVAAQAEKPILFLPEATQHWRDAPPQAGNAYIAGSLDDGLVAMRALLAYAAFRRRVADAAEAQAADAPIAAAPDAPARGVALTEYESKRRLAAAGLPVTREILARSPEEAVSAAERLGYPVALKIQSPALPHKTDVGGVALDLADAGAVRAAYARIVHAVAERAGQAPIDGVLVQEMAGGGVEFLLGMTRDPIFGPVLVLSPGGVFVELFEAGAARRLAPLAAGDVDAMLRGRAIEALLGGFRGQPPADRAALAALIEVFGRFVAESGDRFAAIDLNPVVVLPAGRGAKIVDATIILREDES